MKNGMFKGLSLLMAALVCLLSLPVTVNAADPEVPVPDYYVTGGPSTYTVIAAAPGSEPVTVFGLRSALKYNSEDTEDYTDLTDQNGDGRLVVQLGAAGEGNELKVNSQEAYPGSTNSLVSAIYTGNVSITFTNQNYDYAVGLAGLMIPGGVHATFDDLIIDNTVVTKSLSYDYSVYMAFSMTEGVSGGALTVEDGTQITSNVTFTEHWSNGFFFAITNNGSGTLDFNGGSITCSGSGYYNTGIRNYGDGNVNISGGTINVATDPSSTSHGTVVGNSSGIVTITGGTLAAKTEGVQNFNDGKIYIHGGSVTAMKAVVNSPEGMVDISGGTMTGTGTDYESYAVGFDFRYGCNTGGAINITGSPAIISKNNNTVYLPKSGDSQDDNYFVTIGGKSIFESQYASISLTGATTSDGYQIDATNFGSTTINAGGFSDIAYFGRWTSDQDRTTGISTINGDVLDNLNCGETASVYLDVKKISAPTAVPTNGEFTDNNTASDVVLGNLSWKAPDDTTDVQGYTIYWGSDPSTKSTEASYPIYTIADVNETSAFIADEIVPADGGYFLIYCCNPAGESPTCLAVPVTDNESDVIDYIVTNNTDPVKFDVNGNGAYGSLHEALTHCTESGSDSIITIKFGTGLSSPLKVNEADISSPLDNSVISATYKGYLEIEGNSGVNSSSCGIYVPSGKEAVFDNLFTRNDSLYSKNFSMIYNDSGIVTVKKGSILADNQDNSRMVYGISSAGSGEILISGGTVKADHAIGINSSGLTTVSGGNVISDSSHSDAYAIGYLSDTATGSVSITNSAVFKSVNGNTIMLPKSSNIGDANIKLSLYGMDFRFYSHDLANVVLSGYKDSYYTIINDYYLGYTQLYAKNIRNGYRFDAWTSDSEGNNVLMSGEDNPCINGDILEDIFQGSMTVYLKLTEFPVPTAVPSNGSFTGTAASSGAITGNLSWTAPEDTSGIDGYRLYWGTSATTISADYPEPIYTVADAAVGTQEVSSLAVPEGVKYILVYSYNDGGISESCLAINIDQIPPVLTGVTASASVGDSIHAVSSEDGTLYLVPKTDFVYTTEASLMDVPGATTAACLAYVPAAIPTTGLSAGNYQVYAADLSGNVSVPSDDITLTPAVQPDTTAPVLTGVTASASVGSGIHAVSSEEGTLYLVPKTDFVYTTEASLMYVPGATTAACLAYVPAAIPTTGLSAGTYQVYAADLSGNVSVPSDDITLTPDVLPDTTAPVLTGVMASASVGSGIHAVSSEDGTLYLVPKTDFVYTTEASLIYVPGATTAACLAYVPAAIPTAGLSAGTYQVYAADLSGNVSVPSDDITLTPAVQPDTTAPVLTGVTASASVGSGIHAVSSEDGTLYLVPKTDFVYTTEASLMYVPGATTAACLAYVPAAIPTAGLSAGIYQIYAADMSGNVSAPSDDIVLNVISNNTEAASGNNTSGGAGAGNVPVIIDGNTIFAGMQTTNTASDGRTGTTVIVLESLISSQLAGSGSRPSVVVPISGPQDIKTGVLTGKTVKEMENKDAILEIRTGTTIYAIPANEIKISDISAQLGKNISLADIRVSVTIAESGMEKVHAAGDMAEKLGSSMVIPPVDFTITAEYNGKTLKVDAFNSYVSRYIQIPSGMDPKRITTGVAENADGSAVHHIPTEVMAIDGIYYAKINSLTNSTYFVIWHPYEFTDMKNHWAMDAVNDMGSRLVVEGTGNGCYGPEPSITRAEFAAIVVRALGLPLEIGKNIYNDVKSSEWYCSYIDTATSYGIVRGYGNGEFGPNDNITREQAMSMLARAMKITGLKAEFNSGEAEKLLKSFKDSGSAADYAKEDIAACIKTGIISGRGSNNIVPKGFITRAEVAVTIQRLLKNSGLID